MRLVFMGTPEFAAVSLERLIASGREIVGVYSQPARPKGRGMKTARSPVALLAEKHGIPVFLPETLRTEAVLSELRELRPDLIAVVSYGKLLPDALLEIPPLGCVNVHPSLLPKYRGSSPIQSAVLNGDRETGVSTMYLDREMDTGDIIFQKRTEIGEFETSGELFACLAEAGAALLDRTVRAIEDRSAPRTKQEHALATYTKPLSKELSPIDWAKSPREIVKQICGLQPWPVAETELHGQRLKVFAARYTETVTEKAPGSILSAGKAGIEVACGGGGSLLLTEVQAAGKKRMPAADWLRGHPLTAD